MRRLGWILVCSVALGGSAALGCTATEGSLLVYGEGHELPPGSEDPTLEPHHPAAPPIDPPVVLAGMSFQYQLSGALDLEVEADLFVVDLFQTTAEAITALHERGRVVIAYLSAGTVESYRDDAELFPSEAVGEPFLAFPDESWLDLRHPGVRELMALRLELAKEKSFDGVLPTNLSVYEVDSGFELTAADQLDYTRWLASAARERGLSVGMSGDYRQVESLLDVFDWAMHFECIERSSCASLAPFQELERPVFNVEYGGEIEAICQESARLEIVTIVKPDSLGSEREACL